MKEVLVKLQFAEDMLGKYRLLANILTTEAGEGILGVKNPIKLKGDVDTFVRIEQSNELKRDFSGNYFTTDTPERLAAHKEKEIIRVNKRIIELEESLGKANTEFFANNIRRTIKDLRDYVVRLEKMTDTPHTFAKDVVTFTIVGEYTAEIDETIREAVQVLINQTNPQNHLIKLSVSSI